LARVREHLLVKSLSLFVRRFGEKEFSLALNAEKGRWRQGEGSKSRNGGSNASV
jgi:hypothetical protein